MALAKQVASQHMLRYTFVGTGSITLTVTAAQMLLDCAAGPLKDLLNRVNTGVAGVTWGNLLNSKAISLYVVSAGTSGGTASAAVPLVSFQAGTPNTLTAFLSAGGDTVNGTIEVRYNHSLVR